MLNPSWLWLLGGLSLGVASFSYGQQTILEQDFEAIPEGFTGRFGSVYPGSSPYGIEGRWSEFGVDRGTPRVETPPNREGQAVLLSRVESGSLHPLIGNFNSVYSVSRIRMECDIWLAREGSMVVSINSQNTQAASVLLRALPSGIALWNPRDGAWESDSDRIFLEQWLRLVIDCDFDKATYTVTLLDEQGLELHSAEGLLDSDFMADKGLNNILFNPQPDSSEDCMIDQVLVTAWF